MSTINYTTFQEISVPVPWGVISGKAWGNKDGRRVLGLHGWFHNANSFDKLAPLLSKDIYFVCIDFPGHGKSSHKPPGAVYSGVERIVDLARVVNYLGWEKFSIIGHSLGGNYGIVYAGLFPEQVEKLVVIDVMGGPTTYTLKEAYAQITKKIPSMIKTYRSPKIYPDAESAAKRMVEEDPALTLESARILVVRGTTQVEDGVIFSFDYSLKLTNPSSHLFTEDTIKEIFEHVKCPVLFILGLQSIFLQLNQSLEKSRTSYLKNSPQVEVIGLNGNHNIHLDDPQVVATHINNLLTFQEKKSIKSML